MSHIINTNNRHIAVYSGTPSDVIPMIAFRLDERGRVFAQVPGGASMELSPGLTIQLGITLIGMGRDAFEIIGAPEVDHG